jgi:hypothetical protein
MGFPQHVFGAKNIPQVEQTIVSFGLNESSVWVKDGQMSMIEGSWHSAKKRKYGQIPPDLVVKSQAIDIIGLILSLIRGQDVIETSRRHVKIEV